jgi:tellurium resistance protein TerD
MSIVLDLQKSKGIKLDLAKAAPSLTKLRALITWTLHPIHGKSLTQGFDLDLAVYALNASGKIDKAEDVVFFNNKRYVNDSIVLPGDNRDGDGDGEEILFDLPKVPTDRSQLDLYVFIFDYKARKQNFGMIANAKVELFNADTGELVQTYALNESFSADSAVHVGSLVRESAGWSFSPVGAGATADENDVVQAYC